MNDLTAFDVLMRDNRIVLPSVWEAAFDEIEGQIDAGTPVDVDVLDIARAAWDSLPDEATRKEALDALFYGWWEARQNRKAETAEDDEVHPAPCWFPYHKPCTCFDGPPASRNAGGAR